jgi:hypothetical protein
MRLESIPAKNVQVKQRFHTCNPSEAHILQPIALSGIQSINVVTVHIVDWSEVWKGCTMNPRKTVLVTGVSSGIGKAIAHLLSDKGFRVFGTQRKPPQDEQTSKITMLPLDVRDPQSVQSCVDTVFRHAGRIDALVNNAGYGLIGASEETTLEEAQRFSR